MTHRMASWRLPCSSVRLSADRACARGLSAAAMLLCDRNSTEAGPKHRQLANADRKAAVVTTQLVMFLCQKEYRRNLGPVSQDSLSNRAMTSSSKGVPNAR